MNPPSSAAAIAAPRTGERLHVAVETSAGETYLITFIDSARRRLRAVRAVPGRGPRAGQSGAAPAGGLRRAGLVPPLPRTDQQLNLAIEADDGDPYLVTWLGRTACEAGYEPSELSGEEAGQLARALQDLADVAEGA